MNGDEWTVAGLVDCGMLRRVKSVLRDVHVELELLLILSHNGSKTTVVPSLVCRCRMT